ncbi:MAG: lipoate--protein ligase family protein [Coriobacteriia bacterium]|nr:lipoate--protein ligase family protein [Coriobacteriia bacterium]
MNTWRLIMDGPADGAWNMACDRAILDLHERGESPPTLRLYRWARPTVSLGRFQKLADVDVEVCAERGIGLCRRPTGGRGVLHADEVTYSIVAGVRDGIPRGVGASYRVLCGVLAEAYREMGVPAELTARPRGQRGVGACYLHATQADLSVGVSKLSGSAQMWIKDSCLQHGSFVISRDAPLEAAVFHVGESGEDALVRETCTVSDVLGRRPGGEETVRAVVQGIARGLGVSLEIGCLTEAELFEAESKTPEYRV